MKKYLIAFLFLTILSCTTNDNVLDTMTEKGGYIQFVEVPVNKFNILNTDETFVFSADIEDNNHNASSYTLSVFYEGAEYENLLTINSFPNTLNISMQMILDTLGLTLAELSEEPEFVFVATVISSTGTYTGETPNFDPTTGELDGNTSFKLFTNGQQNAMNFGIKFLLPPPVKLRGTSFEEPVAYSNKYVKAGGATDQEILHNHTDEKIVEYEAVGSGTDDELGFTSEFIPVSGLDGFTSEAMGVQGMAGSVGDIEDGVQAYKVEDTDGMIRLKLDRVEIPSEYNQSGFYMYFYPRLNSSGANNFEAGDIIHIYAEVEKIDGTTETIEMLNIEGAEIQDVGRIWNKVDTGFIADVLAYTIYVDATNNHGNEDIFFDNMVVYIAE